ncbi:MAG: SDR family oxidoreductase [Acidobacteriota bacterium]|jgi:citronellol/citronellal dehydrogenase
MGLEGRVAVITGASRGVGRACALALARKGARVTVAAKSTRDREKLPGTVHSVVAEVEAAGGEALAVPCDVRDREQIRDMVGRTVERFGRLDILVANAGALWWEPLMETPPKRFDLVMKVNLEGTFFACQEAIPHMRRNRWGHIITMSPPVDLKRVPGHIAYFVSKYGMTMIALGLAEELRADGIAANALWPVTLIESFATRNWGLGQPADWRKADILADSVVAIAGHEPAALTGQALLDEPFLRSCGVTDFDGYAVVPGATPRRLDDLWDEA